MRKVAGTERNDRCSVKRWTCRGNSDVAPRTRRPEDIGVVCPLTSHPFAKTMHDCRSNKPWLGTFAHRLDFELTSPFTRIVSHELHRYCVTVLFCNFETPLCTPRIFGCELCYRNVQIHSPFRESLGTSYVIVRLRFHLRSSNLWYKLYYYNFETISPLLEYLGTSCIIITSRSLSVLYESLGISYIIVTKRPLYFSNI